MGTVFKTTATKKKKYSKSKPHALAGKFKSQSDAKSSVNFTDLAKFETSCSASLSKVVAVKERDNNTVGRQKDKRFNIHITENTEQAW